MCLKANSTYPTQYVQNVASSFDGIIANATDGEAYVVA